MTPIFEWDAEKDTGNQLKHGVSFAEARLVFLDPFNITLPDPHHSIEEERFVVLGFAKHRVLVVVFTVRENVIRIISSRRANAIERKTYAQGNR